MPPTYTPLRDVACFVSACTREDRLAETAAPAQISRLRPLFERRERAPDDVLQVWPNLVGRRPGERHDWGCRGRVEVCEERGCRTVELVETTFECVLRAELVR